MEGEARLTHRPIPRKRCPAVISLAALAVVLAAAMLEPHPAGAAAAREVQIKTTYQGVSCPSAERDAMYPLPHAKLIVRFGDRVVRTKLNGKGIANLRLKGKGRKVQATVVFDGDLLAVKPFSKDAPYRFPGVLQLPKKGKRTTLALRIRDREAAGAASAWSILNEGARLAKNASPIPLSKVAARYEQGQRPPAHVAGGEEDIPGRQSAYTSGEVWIDGMVPAAGGVGDEFEPWVLLHEYGHHVLWEIANPGPAGGSHDLERSYPNQPALPWSEGFAHAFAAIALNDPVLGTLCRRGVKLAASPAVPRSKDDPWLNQYHEISVGGVVWGWARHLGGGRATAGLGPLLSALRNFHQRHGGPESLREARDALSIAGGAEKGGGDFDAFVGALGRQKIGWGLNFTVAMNDFREPGMFAFQELVLEMDGPYGSCKASADMVLQFPVRGPLSYTTQEDCQIMSGDGKRPYGIEGGSWGGSMMSLWFPFLAGQAHHNDEFTVKATYHCINNYREPDLASSKCTSDRGFQLWLMRPPRDNSQLADIRFRNGESVDLLRFDAQGECTIIPTGEDCSV